MHKIKRKKEGRKERREQSIQNLENNLNKRKLKISPINILERASANWHSYQIIDFMKISSTTMGIKK